MIQAAATRSPDEESRRALLEIAARLDAELLHENPAALLVRLERLRLATGAVEREHVLAA